MTNDGNFTCIEIFIYSIGTYDYSYSVGQDSISPKTKLGFDLGITNAADNVTLKEDYYTIMIENMTLTSKCFTGQFEDGRIISKDRPQP